MSPIEPTDPRARNHFAAARTQGLMSAELPALEGRPALRVLAALDAPDVCVAPEDDTSAVDTLARSLDALCERADGPADRPIATLWLSYDAARAAADPRPLVDARPRGDRCPAAFLATHRATLVERADTHAVVHRHGDPRALDALDAVWTAEGLGRSERPRLRFNSPTSRRAFTAAVDAVREEIAAGNVYLVNVARRLDAPLGDDPADAIAHRVTASHAARAMVANAGGVLVGAMSMELALRWERRAGVAWSAPIKGTRPRRSDARDDAAEAAALQGDPKERAENAMAVDVHRNDLGRVARAGGVSVPRLFAVETHAFVHHLVSWVRAEVPAELGAREMLRATLPVGSVTGAPKLAAMDAIARVEPARRGLYTGVYGHVFGDGTVEFSVAIRTMVADADGIHYGVGGGIVWDSDPAREWEELGWKSRALR